MNTYIVSLSLLTPIDESLEEGKDQKLVQLSTIPDLKHQMGK